MEYPTEAARIPRVIVQTWHTTTLSPSMAKAMHTVRHFNPEYRYQLFDDAMCRSYLETNFGPLAARAFDELVPGAFKADLWRYGWLFREGGVYVDADFLAY